MSLRPPGSTPFPYTTLFRSGRIVPVRLSLFAEMVKGKPWTPETLRQVRGLEGLGVLFLEETFSARTAPAKHRLHGRSEEHTSELQSLTNLVCRLLLEKKKKT